MSPFGAPKTRPKLMRNLTLEHNTNKMGHGKFPLTVLCDPRVEEPTMP
jgi:hypothetical protein